MGPTASRCGSGYPSLSPSWTLPDSVDAPGGASTITVFNPTGRIDRVRLTVRPGRSPAGRITQTIGPMSAWVLDTAAEPRIPAGLPFSASLRVVSGPGVVVDRTVRAPDALERPQFGAFSALSNGPAQPLARVAVLPGPGTEAQPSVPNALVVGLSVVNAAPYPITVTVWSLEGVAGLVVLTRLSVPVGRSMSLPRALIGAARRLPIVVSGDGPLGVLEDLAPSAGLDVVALAGAGAPSS